MMPNAIPSREASLNVPQRYVSQQVQTTPQSSQVDGGETYQYLRLHGIPSKVERMFSGVLNDRPEDPLQYIVDYLRQKNGVTSTHPGMSHNTSSCALKPVSLPNVHVGGRPRRGSCSLTPSDVLSGPVERPQTGPGPEPAPPAKDEASEVTADVLMPHEPGTPVGTGAPMASPSAEAMLHTSLNSMSRTNACIIRPSSSAMMPPWTSLRSSRNGTPYTGATSFRLGGNVVETAYGSTGALSLDRDESTRSDLSAFSVASVDMQDFLQEFRSAKANCVGIDAKLVSVEELSDILQQVNVPLPDIPIISDLFDEVKVVGELRYPHSDEDGFINDNASLAAAAAGGEKHERVHFDAFLARMALIIQGRYPAELIRGTFYTILESAVQRRCSAAAAAAAAAQQSKLSLKGGGDSTRMGSSGDVTSRSFRFAAKSACCRGGGGGGGASSGFPATALRTSGVGAVMQTYPSSSAHRAAPSDMTDSAQFSTLLNGVPLAICVEEGLWHGLGIPVTKSEVVSALRVLGIPHDDDYEFHVSDFMRLVNALTGQGVLAVSDKSSTWMSSFGRDSSILPHGGSCKDD